VFYPKHSLDLIHVAQRNKWEDGLMRERMPN
jgi:hypothetical protein